MLGWWRLLLLYGIAINLGIDESVSTALDVNGSKASDEKSSKGVNGSKASEKNGSTASDMKAAIVADPFGLINMSGLIARRFGQFFPTQSPPPPSSSCYVALRHRDYPPPSELLDKMNHWGSDDFKEGKTHVERRCTNIPECQTFTCKEKGKKVFVVNACGRPEGGCDDYIDKLCKGAGECDICTNEKEDSLCNKEKLEFFPKKPPKNTTAVSGAGVALHSSILFSLLPICVVMWM
uniref:Uncharacterized protein n=1 Tax=Globodera rostochiensis TaxID=31243 RepID=A0A914HB24_GLORO